MVPQRFFAHGQRSQGDRHVYASWMRFIPEKLLGLFERANWPITVSGTATRAISQGPRIDIAARMRGMWHSSSQKISTCNLNSVTKTVDAEI